MEEILIWLVVASTAMQFCIWVFTPKPLTQTHYDFTRLSVEEIQELVEEAMKEPNKKLRGEMIEQRLKMQDYHLRQKIKDRKDEERNNR